jgi:YidC/Oxa1 family membrane protein insertase
MDRNSIIGLLLMGAILLGYGVFMGPDEEDVKNNGVSTELVESHKPDSIVADVKAEVSSVDVPVEEIIPAELSLKLDENGVSVLDSASQQPIYVNSITGEETILPSEVVAVEPLVAIEELVTLKNDLIEVEFTTKGGLMTKALISNYRSHTDYVNEVEGELQLFDEKSNYGIQFTQGGKTINTKDLDFKVIENTTHLVKLEAKSGDGFVYFKYALKDGAYDFDYSISFKGISDSEAPNTKLLADFTLLSTEKHMNTERMVTSVFYDEDGGYHYMSEGGDDDYELESSSRWVSFKQSFFNAMIMSESGFEKGSKLTVTKFEDEDTVYLKNMTAELNLGATNMTNSIDLKWYLGPNEYEILETYDNGAEGIVNLGWGLFRWINIYALRPMFRGLLGWGMGAGLAILLLTFIVKIVLSPVNYKMYKSSAMMKVLKPEIADITAKFPDKKDGMKKQQALMALYKQAGASPMAGCVPMLFQMPILFAIFRLFPSSIEMRQKGFLWAEDLSSYDSIYNFGFDIPLYGDHVSLFTLLMAATTLIYTHFNSGNMQQPQQEGMPNMKYIMYFFPFMMIFFFNNYSSGLSFYYFISTLMTMLIMLSIKYFILDENKIHAKIAANKANPKKAKGKSKFAQRLEEAQKMQMDKQNNKKK